MCLGLWNKAGSIERVVGRLHDRAGDQCIEFDFDSIIGPDNGELILPADRIGLVTVDVGQDKRQTEYFGVKVDCRGDG